MVEGHAKVMQLRPPLSKSPCNAPQPRTSVRGVLMGVPVRGFHRRRKSEMQSPARIRPHLPRVCPSAAQPAARCSPSCVHAAHHCSCRHADGRNAAAEAFKGQKCQGKASQSQILKLIYILTFSLALAQAVILVNEPQCVWIYSVIFAWGENPLFSVLL